MVAIGDAEGTVSVMQLCRSLYETTVKEKEMMQQIFEREFRREKNLDIMRKMQTENKGPKKEKNPELIAKQKEEEVKGKIKNIEEKFFEHVADEQHGVDAIKARAGSSKPAETSPAQ
jgi:dynein intermediate chain 2